MFRKLLTVRTLEAVTAVVALVGAVIGLVVVLHGGGGTGSSNRKRVYHPSPARPTTTAKRKRPPSPPPGPAVVGLDALNDANDVQAPTYETKFSTRYIGGQPYSDAVTSTVYPDGSGLTKIRIDTTRRFARMSFVVGIDSRPTCSDGVAQVAVTDEAGHSLWGPKRVTIDDVGRAHDLVIPRPIQVNLVQHSLQPDDSPCDHGAAQVSWGGVEFSAG